MQQFDLFNFKIRAIFFAPALLLLASCGSYQYSGYGNDGIYSSSSEDRETITSDDYEESYEDALYYKQLFAEKAEQFGNVPEEGAIFTDIDGYTSTGMYEDELFLQEDLNYNGGNAPWGADPDEIAINFYGSYYPYVPFYDPYNPYLGYAGFYNYHYNPFFGRNFGRGYGYGFNYGYGRNPWRFNYGYHNTWGWNYWNAGIYHPYHYGYGYGTPYLGSYTRKDVAYSDSRRDSRTDFRLNSRNNSDARSSRVGDYANSRGVRAERSSLLLRSNRTASENRTYSTRASRVESVQSRARSRSNSDYRSNNSRSYDRSTEARSSRSRREYNNNTSTQTRQSTSTSRSRGTVRSSSSSSRSSGSSGSSGSSRSNRGRGN